MSYYYAFGTSKTAKELMPEYEYKQYQKEKEMVIEEYFNLAIQSQKSKELLDTKVLIEINKFNSSNEAWKKLKEFRELNKILKNIEIEI